jgi:outer membrane protein assembly factor BamA
VAFENQDVSRTTGYLDWRAYNTIFYRNSIALRLTGAASVGEDRRVFYLGGPYTLRGYDWQQFVGTKMWLASFEYRFPLFDYLIFGWPGRWGFSNIGANLFFDVGNTWVDRWPKVFDSNAKGLRLDDAKADMGFGVFMDVGYFLMNLQFAWPTDLEHVDQNMKFHFAIGPTF